MRSSPGYSRMHIASVAFCLCVPLLCCVPAKADAVEDIFGENQGIDSPQSSQAPDSVQLIVPPPVQPQRAHLKLVAPNSPEFYGMAGNALAEALSNLQISIRNLNALNTPNNLNLLNKLGRNYSGNPALGSNLGNVLSALNTDRLLKNAQALNRNAQNVLSALPAIESRKSWTETKPVTDAQLRMRMQILNMSDAQIKTMQDMYTFSPQQMEELKTLDPNNPGIPPDLMQEKTAQAQKLQDSFKDYQPPEHLTREQVMALLPDQIKNPVFMKELGIVSGHLPAVMQLAQKIHELNTYLASATQTYDATLAVSVRRPSSLLGISNLSSQLAAVDSLSTSLRSLAPLNGALDQLNAGYKTLHDKGDVASIVASDDAGALDALTGIDARLKNTASRFAGANDSIAGVLGAIRSEPFSFSELPIPESQQKEITDAIAGQQSQAMEMLANLHKKSPQPPQ